MKDQNCAYCMQGELVAKFGYPVCQMKSGYLYIFKEQSKPGRVILAYKDHVSEMVDISDEDRNEFFAEVAQVGKVIHKLFKPDKVNYGAYRLPSAYAHRSQIQRQRRVGKYLPDESGQGILDRRGI